MNETCSDSADQQITALEVSALRRLTPAQAATLRASVPGELADLAHAVPGGVVELLMWCAVRDEVHLRWTAGAEEPSDAADLADALRAVLAPSAELAVTPRWAAPAGVAAWPLIPAVNRAPVGFGDDVRVPSLEVLGPGGEPDGSALLALLADHAGTGFRFRCAGENDRRGERWVRLEVAALTQGRPPSVATRALLGRWTPGLVLSPRVLTEGWFAVPRERVSRIFPVPTATTGSAPGVDVGSAPPLPAPRSRQDQSVLRLGTGWSTSGTRREVVLTNAERARHVHVIGRTGTGKSTLLAAAAHAAAAAGEGLLVVDPHGHLVDRIAAELPASAVSRTWLIRAGNTDAPVRINPLAVADPARREVVIADLGEMFSAMFDRHQQGIVGPRFQERLAVMLRSLIEVRGLRASLLDAPRLSTDPELQERVRARLTDRRLVTWWDNDERSHRSNDHGELVSWFSSKFERLSGNAALRAVLGTGINAVDMVEAMDSRRIILVDLSKGVLGRSAARTLGLLYLSAVWSAALQRATVTPFTVLVDEAHTFSDTSLPDMLAEGRKFGVVVGVAHQHMSQLDKPLAEALTGNVATTVAFRTGNEDARGVASSMGGDVTPTLLTSLPDLHAIVHRTSSATPDQPHTVQMDHSTRVQGLEGQALDARVRWLESRTAEDLSTPFDGAREMRRGDLISSPRPLLGPPPGVTPREGWPGAGPATSTPRPVRLRAP